MTYDERNSMTEKDFKAIAAALYATEASYRTVGAVANVLAESNPDFDWHRFLAAAYDPTAKV